jgi:hypothetical protein
VGVSDADLEPLFRSAEAYVALWERIEGSSHFPPTLTISAAPVPNAAGWNRADVTVTANAAESTYGWPLVHLSYAATGAQPIGRTDTTSLPVQLAVAAEGSTEATFTALDEAGNLAPEHALTVRIDRTLPVTACAPYDGLWHAQNVVLACTASDAVSGLATPADASFSLSTSIEDGVETSTASTDARTVSDRADNAATSGPVTNVKIDRKDPAIAVASPAAGAVHVVNEPVTASYACTDGGSGVATCAGPAASGAAVATGTPGTHEFRVDATDAVGNAATAAVTYQVTYALCLLYDPSKAKNRGATYPLKVSLCDAAGANLSSAAVALTATGLRRVSDQISGVVEDAGQANPDQGFRWDAALGGYVYNVATAALATGTWALRFTASGDPIPHEVLLQVK